MTASPPGSDSTNYEVSTIQSGTDLEYNISGLDPVTNYSIFVSAIGILDQATGRVDTEILALTKSGMEVKYLLDYIAGVPHWDLRITTHS